ncbi:unnamed protein product, partial [marine sediment metagenome]
MKTLKIWLFLGIAFFTFLSCSKAKEDRFPSYEEASGLKSGEIIWNTGIFTVKDKQHEADFGILAVQE